jgi:hypothetical protein
VVLLFLIGKLGITSSFGVIVVYTAELYPTAMRSIGVGTSNTVARLGAMLAPFVPLLVSLRNAHCAPSIYEATFQTGHILYSWQGVSRPFGNSRLCFYPKRRAVHRLAYEVCRMCLVTFSCHVMSQQKGLCILI